MNQAQFYCRSKKRFCYSGGGLPAEYQQVEYLENSGEEYIITPFIPYQTMVTELKFSLTQSPSFTSMMMFGVRSTQGSVYDTNYWARIYSASQLEFPSGAGVNSIGRYNISLLPGVNELYYTSGTIKLNGSVIGSLSSTYYFNVPIYLWCRATYSRWSLGYTNISSGGLRIHEVKFTNDGALVGNFIPCYRKSDNKPGMYDLVTNAFFTNAGTGEFTVGSNF